MTIKLIAALLLIALAWRVWRQGGLVTALIALTLGVIVTGPIEIGVRGAVNLTRSAVVQLSNLTS